MTARFIVADVFDGLATLETGSVDLVVTSPPFLALRSYLPADHADKSKEIGSESTPSEWLDLMLRVTAELRRVLAPHGSICIELGDTYAADQGRGAEWTMGGDRFTNKGPRRSFTSYEDRRMATVSKFGNGWPLPKSRTLIPSLYQIALAYGINPLTGSESPAGQWRIRNIVTWARPNPPVGALGDKWRPATSDLIVACTSSKRYWDDLATRRPLAPKTLTVSNGLQPSAKNSESPTASHRMDRLNDEERGAPLLDYWVIPPGGYSGQVATEWKRPVDRGESVGDIRRTTSADCPEHGDQPDPIPTGSHDEPVSEVRSPHNYGSESRPVQGQLSDSAPTDQTTELVTEASSSDSLDQPYVPVAKPRSKASNRTGLAPATNPPGKPSEETSPDIAGRPTSPLSGEHHPDTAENRTSEDGSADSPTTRTAGRTPDIETGSAVSCTCSYYVLETKYTSHYAVFPEELVVPCVQAMCPQRVCVTCGEPSRRIVETSYKAHGDPARHNAEPKARADYALQQRSENAQGMANGRASRIDSTLGWTDCGHNDYRNGIVLDPFAGSGTTLAVATGHGHDAIGIDIDHRNAELARDRVGPFLFEMVDLPA